MLMATLLALGVVSGETVSAAIERAVVARMGNVQVVVRKVSTMVPDQADLTAAAEPGARLGQPIRFVLFADGKRVGSAVATLDVTGEAPWASRALARDEEIAASDVQTVMKEISGVAIRRLPAATDLVGTRARRDIASGELLTNALVVVPPAVRSGDQVSVLLKMGPVQVSGMGRASGSGQIGDTVRVTTLSGKKSLNARITGRGAVEIVR
jgi:flagella basal body P-ring formation protein FlgA